MKNRRESGVALLTAVLLLLMMSCLTIGFALLLMTDERVTGWDKNYSQSWYGAEAGMEKMTNDLGTLFAANFAPTAADINGIAAAPPTQNDTPGILYLNPDNTVGYQIVFQPNAQGNPQATVRTILPPSPYAGLTALTTPYTLTVTTRQTKGGEVRLRRFTQTAAIPAFQFGIYSAVDLSFFAGPNFNFGGRVHTNGNLFLAEGGGNTLTMADRVTAVGKVVRDHLSNGWNTAANYTGVVNICDSSCTANPITGTFTPLQYGQGSVTGPNDVPNSNWGAIAGQYNGNLRNNAQGVTPLNLPFTTLGAQPIDLIRRPTLGEAAAILGQRYFSQASFRVLISDNAADITGLPCVSGGAPVDLSTLAVQPALLPAWYNGAVPVPLAASGAAQAAGGAYTPNDGYWIPTGQAVITGFIKIEIKTAQGNPCGTFTDVTQEVLKLGVAGRNLNPTAPFDGATLPGLPGAPIGPSGCPDANPTAVIRLERVRDNPSTGGANPCGQNFANSPPTDFWPNVLFDTREGNPRDNVPALGTPRLGGVMHYVELDVTNLAQYLTGALGGSGALAFDNTNATNDFVVYFSDRRGNHNGNPNAAGTETGRYGFGDFVNPASQWGCPNGAMDQGEDLDGVGGVPQVYGQNPIFPANSFNLQAANAIQADANCAAPATPWPGWFVTQTQDARENPPIFFRRALKIRNGNNINLGACPGGLVCGLTIASENPVYAEGDFNANSAAGGFNDPNVPAAVIADSFTFLSNNWNDVNSFAFPYSPGQRQGITTWYRMGIVAGKGISFPKPNGYAAPQDFGTDGGAHNFLRYLEGWNGTLNYRGSIVSMYFNRQGIGIYKCCNTVYSPPTRGYNFDTTFLDPSLLPPRTPMFRTINTTGFVQLNLSTQ